MAWILSVIILEQLIEHLFISSNLIRIIKLIKLYNNSDNLAFTIKNLYLFHLCLVCNSLVSNNGYGPLKCH